MKIPLLIIGLIVLYILLSVSFETFNVVQNIPEYKYSIKDELIIKPQFLPGHIPIGSKQNKIVDTSICNKRTELVTKERENVNKYIRNSMLLNKPNLDIGYLPSNVRFVELMYNKPQQIGKLPIYNDKVQEEIKISTLPIASQEDNVSEEA